MHIIYINNSFLEIKNIFIRIDSKYYLKYNETVNTYYLSLGIQYNRIISGTYEFGNI